jgi:hypothetical protein
MTSPLSEVLKSTPSLLVFKVFSFAPTWLDDLAVEAPAFLSRFVVLNPFFNSEGFIISDLIRLLLLAISLKPEVLFSNFDLDVFFFFFSALVVFGLEFPSG